MPLLRARRLGRGMTAHIPKSTAVDVLNPVLWETLL